MSYPKFGKWIYRFRGKLVSPPLVLAALSFSSETENDRLIWLLGISVFLFGFVLRIWAQQHIHYRLKVYKQLTTTGPYSFVRNPIYIGNTLLCLGATVASELLWFVPVTLFWCIGIYALVVRYEEVCLLDQYGESYCRYMLKVPRWFPRTMPFKNMGLINEHFRKSVVAEIHCLLLLLPYILKEVISPWLEH